MSYFEKSFGDTVKIIKNETNLGYSAGFNIGIDKAIANGAEYVLIINSDTIVDSGILKELLKVFSEGKIIGFVK